jgi:carbamoyl-phosphate synthase/aspartate carbamoyltransferase/dihydroorotase
MPQYIKDYVANYPNIIQQQTVTSLETAIQDANVLYVTRIQKERFDSQQAYESVIKKSCIVDTKLLSSAPSDMIVMHPLPRVHEIATEVDADPRAAYFRQMENGMFIRMAILALVTGTAV